MSPLVVAGESALNPARAVPAPVPPREIAKLASEERTPLPSLIMTWLAVPEASLVRAIAALVATSALTMLVERLSLE